MIFDNRPLLTQTDKLCLAALAGVLVTATLCYELTDGAALRAAEADKPSTVQTAVTECSTIDCAPLVEAVEARKTELREEEYWAAVPLDRECRAALEEACEEHGVPLCLALGLMETESGFQPEADNGVSVGLMQLNRRYFPDDLTPVENIRAGVEYFGKLLEQYDGDTQAALTVYNAGHDTGGRTYAHAVLAASEKWGNG